MNADMYTFLPEIPHRKTRHEYQRTARHTGMHSHEGFRCKYCQAYVHNLPILSGVQNRNHCPYCLRSRHLDLEQPGDRLSACKGSMHPIGLTVKPGRNKYATVQMGELMLIHRCIECGTISLNRIASDDLSDGLISVVQHSMALDQSTLQQLVNLSVCLLKVNDLEIVSWQLYGSYQN